MTDSSTEGGSMARSQADQRIHPLECSTGRHLRGRVVFAIFVDRNICFFPGWLVATIDVVEKHKGTESQRHNKRIQRVRASDQGQCRAGDGARLVRCNAICVVRRCIQKVVTDFRLYIIITIAGT